MVQKARKQGTVYVKVRFGRILQLTVLNLQVKKPIFANVGLL